MTIFFTTAPFVTTVVNASVQEGKADVGEGLGNTLKYSNGMGATN